MAGARDSEIEVLLRLISSGNYDKEVAQMLAAKQAAKGLSDENVSLSKTSVGTEAEIARLSATLKDKLNATTQTTRSDVERMRGTLEAAGFSGKTLEGHMSQLFTTLNKPRILSDLRQGFRDAGLGIKEADTAAGSMVNQVVQGLGSLNPVIESSVGFFAKLGAQLPAVTQAMSSFAGGIPVIGGPLSGLIGMLGGLGPIGFGILIPVLGGIAAALAILAVNIGSVVLALAAMIGTFIAATFVLTAFGFALFGVLGMLALAAAPILAIVVAIDAMSASQATAAQQATAQLTAATQSYQAAQSALRQAQLSTALPTAQNALNVANQRLAMAQANLGARPGSIGAQGALSQATTQQALAQQNFSQVQQTEAQRLATANQNLANAHQKLIAAQQALAQSNQGVVDAFAALDKAFQKVQQAWVNAAAPMMKQVADALIAILPFVQQLGLDIIHWLGGVMPSILREGGKTFKDFLEILRGAGRVFGDFFQKALDRFPELESVFVEFGKRGVDAFEGVLTNLLRLADWFTSNRSTLQPIIEEILGGLGNAVQGFFDQAAAFIQYIVANWPTIGPVFEHTIKSIIGFFDGLWKNFGKLIKWLDEDFPTVQKKAEKFLDQLGKDLQMIGIALDYLGKIIQADETFWGNLWEKLQPIFKAFGKGFHDAFDPVAPILKALLKPLADAWSEFSKSLGGTSGSSGIIQLLSQLAYWLGQIAGQSVASVALSIELLAIALLKVGTAISNVVKIMAGIPGGDNNIVFQIIAAFASSGSSLLPHHFASGGVVPGGGTGDSVPALLTPGEGVLNVDAMRRIGGASGLNALNGGGGLGGGTGAILASIEAHLAALATKAMGTVNVTATAIDYRALAREITHQQRFAASTGTL